MNLQSIITANFVSITALVILMISSHYVRQRRLLSDRIFTVMILFTAASCVVETASFAIDGMNFFGAHAVDVIASTFLFASNTLMSFLWCVYVDMRLFHSKKRLRKYYPYLAIPAVVSLAAIVLNLRFGFLFTVDSDNVYHRQPLGSALQLVTIFYFSCSIFLRRSYYKRFGKLRFFPIFLFIIPTMLGTTLQMLFYGVSLGWCSVALGLVGIHMGLQNELAYIDPLTKIFNRNYLNHVMQELRARHADAFGIMVDIDKFKSINDTYGHSTGDEALVNAAAILSQSAPENASVTRFAGDEFVIVIRGGSESSVKETIEEMRSAAAEFSNSGKTPYKITFSIGYCRYEPDKSTDKFFSRMDEEMYKDKNRRSAVQRA